jgi:hypothetical protein
LHTKEQFMAAPDIEPSPRPPSVSDLGLQWVERKRAELEALPTGTVVVIDIETGEYVTGKTGLEAHPLFKQRFGAAARGFVHRVRDRTFIGGGIG